MANITWWHGAVFYNVGIDDSLQCFKFLGTIKDGVALRGRTFDAGYNPAFPPDRGILGLGPHNFNNPWEWHDVPEIEAWISEQFAEDF